MILWWSVCFAQSLEALMAEHQVPGLAVAVIAGGELLDARGVGVREAGSADPVTAETRFQIGSISKTIAAFVSWRLFRQGRLDLDAEVREGLHSFRLPSSRANRDRLLTARMLLQHRGGINLHGSWGWPRSQEPLPSLLVLLQRRVRMVSPPNTRWSYSTGGYCVLEQWLVDTQGRSYAALAQQEVFDPIGMSGAGFAPVADGTYATGHTRGEPVEGRWYWYPFAAGGGAYASVEDMARYAQAILDAWHGRDARWLDRQDLEQMLARPDPDSGYALGWHVQTDAQGRRTIHHRGLNRGFSALLAIELDEDNAAAVLTNAESGASVWQAAITSVTAERAP